MSRERLTGPQAATRAGVKPATWRAYVTRGQAPAADGRYDERTPWWWASTVETWMTNRTQKRTGP